MGMSNVATEGLTVNEVAIHSSSVKLPVDLTTRQWDEIRLKPNQHMKLWG